MKKNFAAGILLGILAFSFILMAPMTVKAEDTQLPDLGNNPRIEFLDYIIKAIAENQTRFDLTSGLYFNGKVAYFSIKSSDVIRQENVNEQFNGLVYTGINDESGHKIYLRTNASLTVNQLNFTQDAYVHFIIWDNDGSLLSFLMDLNNAMQANDTLKLLDLLLQVVLHCESVFNGDEVFIISPIFFWTLDFDISYQIDNQYLNDSNDNGPYDEIGNSTYDMDFTQLPMSIRQQLVAKAAGGAPALQYLMNDTTMTTKQGSYSDFFYLIQQIWLKKLYFTLDQGFKYDVDIVSVRHLLFRAALYNDTDGNGLMDVAFNETTTGNYYPYSTEAVSVLEIVNASSIVFGEPMIDETPGNEKIQWNATITNPFVRLNPYGQSPETGVLINAPIVPMGDSSFGFTFKPQAVESGRMVDLQGVLKIDQTFGAMNGTEGLKGLYKDLDLAIVYLSDIFELAAKEKISGSVPQTNATAQNDKNQTISATITKTTSETQSLNFFIGTSCVTGIDLTGAKYSIGNEDPSNPTHSANGAIIPYGMYQHSIEQTGAALSQKVKINWNISASVTHNTYIYQVSYPEFNGSKIVHDPTYTILGTATYPGGGIPGFEFYGIFLSMSIVSCVVIFLKKKTASIVI
jgi:hypothetical protein